MSVVDFRFELSNLVGTHRQPTPLEKYNAKAVRPFGDERGLDKPRLDVNLTNWIAFFIAFSMGTTTWLFQGPRIGEVCLQDEMCNRKLALNSSWLPEIGLGRMDLRDHQWRTYRSSMHLLAVFAVAFVGVRYFIANRIGTASRKRTNLVLSSAFMLVLHGSGVFWIFSLIGVWYGIMKQVKGTRFAPVVVIALSVFTLMLKYNLNRYCKFGAIFGFAGQSIDRWSGMYRWEQPLNLLLLRLISFSMDL